jgi:hypothetical protein
MLKMTYVGGDVGLFGRDRTVRMDVVHYQRMHMTRVRRQ